MKLNAAFHRDVNGFRFFVLPKQVLKFLALAISAVAAASDMVCRM